MNSNFRPPYGTTFRPKIISNTESWREHNPVPTRSAIWIESDEEVFLEPLLRISKIAILAEIGQVALNLVDESQ
jgi:hypothetical protein